MKMKTRVWLKTHLLLLITVSQCGALILPCKENAYSGKNSYLYGQLESALLSNPDALYALHIAFFKSNAIPRRVASIEFNLEVNRMEPFDCSTVKCSTNQFPVANGMIKNDSQQYEYNWNFQWSSSAVSSQIIIGEFLAFHPLLSNILYDRVSVSWRRTAKVRLRIESLNCTVATDDVFYTVTAFLTWVSHTVYIHTILGSVDHMHGTSEYCERFS